MSILLSNVVKNFKGLPHQVEALKLLDRDAAGLGILEDDRDWVKLWRFDGLVDIPNQAIDFIKQFEGLKLSPYLDGVGVPTIGYGTTIYPNGKEVWLGDKPISKADADIYMANDLRVFWDTLKRTIPFWAEMPINKRSALLSFAYNCGANFYMGKGYATISRVLFEKDWGEVPRVFMLYVNLGTSVEAGLRRRRKAEGALWSGKPDVPPIESKDTCGKLIGY